MLSTGTSPRTTLRKARKDMKDQMGTLGYLTLTTRKIVSEASIAPAASSPKPGMCAGQQRLSR
jgi:hypothetical protein